MTTATQNKDLQTKTVETKKFQGEFTFIPSSRVQMWSASSLYVGAVKWENAITVNGVDYPTGEVRVDYHHRLGFMVSAPTLFGGIDDRDDMTTAAQKTVREFFLAWLGDIGALELPSIEEINESILLNAHREGCRVLNRDSGSLHREYIELYSEAKRIYNTLQVDEKDRIEWDTLKKEFVESMQLSLEAELMNGF